MMLTCDLGRGLCQIRKCRNKSRETNFFLFLRTLSHFRDDSHMSGPEMITTSGTTDIKRNQQQEKEGILEEGEERNWS